MRLYGRHKVPYLIFIFQRKWKRSMQFWYWFVRCTILKLSKRIFVFRCAPNWFVFLLADGEYFCDEEDFNEFISDAKKERALRKMNRRMILDQGK